jgi:hypothetical protein
MNVVFRSTCRHEGVTAALGVKPEVAARTILWLSSAGGRSGKHLSRRRIGVVLGWGGRGRTGPGRSVEGEVSPRVVIEVNIARWRLVIAFISYPADLWVLGATVPTRY